MSKKEIDISVPSGFRDYLPEDMIPRQWMLDTIRGVFEKFGFQPLDTSGIEREEVLTGGDPDFDKQIFRSYTKDRPYGLALRFDLTVPLARVVSLYPGDIQKPFKRYQMGKVWRGEKPQAGRFCEFMQFDADIIGSSRLTSDAEIVSVIYETMTALGVGKFLIRVNNRKILNGLANFAGYDRSKSENVMRVLDKLDKLDWTAVSKELAESVGLTQDQIERLKTFIDSQSDNQLDTVARIEELMVDSPDAKEGIQELKRLVYLVDALGVPRDFWSIDLSVARGLGYYTGIVFETVLPDLLSIGSVFSGGRYDNLVQSLGGEQIPATGASVGVDRLFAALSQLRLLPEKKTQTEVVVLNFDPDAEIYNSQVATTLRQNGFCTELYLGREQTIKGQLTYALKQGVPVVVISGGNERGRNVVQVKDLRSRTQVEVPVSKVVEAVRDFL